VFFSEHSVYEELHDMHIGMLLVLP